MRYQAIITELGADLDSGMTVGETTTHLIINSPSKLLLIYLLNRLGYLRVGRVLHSLNVQADARST